MKRKWYSEEFKSLAAQLALSGEKSRASVAQDFGISESTLYGWIEKFSSGAFSAQKRKEEKPALSPEVVQQQLRDVHARRLDYIYQQAQLAWRLTNGEQHRNHLTRFRQALQSDSFSSMTWGEELFDKLCDLVDTIFPGQQVGDPRFLEKMLSALADERRMWDANLAGKKPAPPPEEIFDVDTILNDEERLVLVRKLFDEAQRRDLATCNE